MCFVFWCFGVDLIKAAGWDPTLHPSFQSCSEMLFWSALPVKNPLSNGRKRLTSVYKVDETQTASPLMLGVTVAVGRRHETHEIFDGYSEHLCLHCIINERRVNI